MSASALLRGNSTRTFAPGGCRRRRQSEVMSVTRANLATRAEVSSPRRRPREELAAGAFS